VAAGGSTGQVLQKLSSTSYDTGWATLPADYINSVSAPLAVASGVLSVDLSTYLPLAGGYMTGAIFNTNAIGGLYLSNFSLGADRYTNVSWSQISLSGGSGSSAKSMTIQGDGITFWHGGISKQTVAYPGAEILFDNAALTGNPSAPTQATSDNSTRIATTAFVKAQGYLTSAPVTSVAGKVGVVTLDNTDISGLGSLAVVNDAPSNGSQYARKNAAWDVVIPGDRYLTTSTTSLTINNANKTLTIGTGLSYTPTQNITISYDASNHMHGEVLTYNSGTGVLTVDVNHHTGSGTYASWVVNVGGVTPATSVAWGAITGTLSTQTDLQSALDLKANLASPALTGNPTSVTPATSDNDTSIATTAFVKAQGYLTTASASADYLSKAGNLSGLANTATARTNIQLGATNTVAFRAVNLSEGAPEIDDTLSTLNVITSSGGYGVGGSTASYVDDGSGSAIVSESGSFGLDKNNFSLALYPTYDSSNPSSPTSGIELNYVTATGVLSLRAYDNPGSTDYVTTLSPFGLILPASGGSITFGDATVQTTAAFNPDLSPYAPLASPTFTGTPTLPTGTIATTQSPGDNTTALASTAFVTASNPDASTTVKGHVELATDAELIASSSTTTVITPKDYRLAGLTTNVWAPGASGLSSGQLGTGANASSTYTALNGRLLAPSAATAGYASRGFNLFYPSNTTPAGYNFGTASGHSIRAFNSAWGSTVAGVKMRSVFGRMGAGLPAPATLAVRGYGWEWSFSTKVMSIIAHDGTTLTTTAVTWVPVGSRTYEIMALSNGAGTISLYVDGTLLGTSSGGPTTTSSASQLWWQTEIQNEATAGAQLDFYFQNPKVFTTNG
jgi:hypothetical protein